ncbi:STAS domain-containing protein [Solirubrobacter sp. CPCC 204708]|uniref:Anti-sigma factor antagonist n=1 Tax=Solirubrobacter deserti TaxID=2282478 RepID=A0ABT4RCD9_9ACTN|nr:STAS domain-containing protein [Solirubrobacter deserti]MBE2315564.1 STAS domain-containing protein [Solirubrobacter deserti]MDA0136203.1 STAS domain-containing protein [Solirubrobacter deserti]
MEVGPEFSVTRRRVGETIVVAPVGEIDLGTVDAVEAEIEQGLAEPHRELVLDLRAVSFLDSTGIRLVVELARDHGPAFAVVRGTGEVDRVFGLVGLDGRVRMLDLAPGE